jgi:hypothetical protein
MQEITPKNLTIKADGSKVYPNLDLDLTLTSLKDEQ